MAFLLLTCLLAFLPVVSMKSPIFGPQDVRSVEGSSVSIKCYYPATSVNRHSRKYWCRQGDKGPCTTLISSGPFVSENYAGRAKLTDFPEDNLFVVDIAQLTTDDTGKYKCGLGVNNRGLSYDVNLEVSKGLQLSSDTQIYIGELGRKVTIQCPFKDAQTRKALNRKSGQSFYIIIDSGGYKNNNYKDRADLNIDGTSGQTFSVTIDRLRVDDAGVYLCEAGDLKRNVYLQVLKPELELVYKDLRSAVSFDCDLGSGMEKKPKYLCRMSPRGEACYVIINTQGEKAQGFEGRILITSSSKDSTFSVQITGLKKEDAGHYVCGALPLNVTGDSGPIKAWQLFVNEESSIPHSPTVVKGVPGGSVAIFCPYNPKDNPLKYWCHWKEAQNGFCPLLVKSEGLVDQAYQGRLALREEPGNGTYTVLLNQLSTRDAGFYWCLTNGDSNWNFTVELKVIEGEPSLKVPENITVSKGDTVKLPCHFPCKFYPHEKYWCKWSNTGCQALPSQDEGPSDAFVNCDQNSQVVSLTLNSVTEADQGWYWCGVKQGQRYGETAAVYVTVQDKAKAPQGASPANAAPGREVVRPNVRRVENKAVQDPRLVVVQDFEAPAGESKTNTQGSADGHSGSSSTVLLSTLVPLALVLVAGVVVVGILRARHRKNVDRVSIQSYRTDFSLSDLNSSRDFGANDNIGASPASQETSLGGKDDLATTTESTVEREEVKKAKRSSKEEADMAYSAFLIQSNSMAANVRDGPQEA
ncbi:PREDICTED: polymeric immunoglobulin receptor [Elephantulus edwardii]|uniref:polymeric immunoglobulin receptor n=1 Tax=Elephantulus edwardii TaxID=28737 RepID=UPI0003F0B58F|nr:PREDICTED: polymeric immunoglobulin receptor [Elephantulus edwardii]